MGSCLWLQLRREEWFTYRIQLLPCWTSPNQNGLAALCMSRFIQMTWKNCENNCVHPKTLWQVRCFWCVVHCIMAPSWPQLKFSIPVLTNRLKLGSIYSFNLWKKQFNSGRSGCHFLLSVIIHRNYLFYLFIFVWLPSAPCWPFFTLGLWATSTLLCLQISGSSCSGFQIAFLSHPMLLFTALQMCIFFMPVSVLKPKIIFQPFFPFLS